MKIAIIGLGSVGSAVATAVANTGLVHEIVLFDPDIVLIENCTGGKMEQYRQHLIQNICKTSGLEAQHLPEIRILESGVRHAYRGLAICMRSAWIQKEVN